MNDFYDAIENDSYRLDDNVELIDDVFDPAGIDDSLKFALGGSNGKKRIDSRQHKRFQLSDNAFAIIRSIHTEPLKIIGKSMACIACEMFNSKPVKLGKIDNISMGGLMFQHVDCEAQSNKALVLDILLADCGFYMANISFKTIHDRVVPNDIPSNHFEMRQVHLQFQKLDVDQIDRLMKFIFYHGTEINAIGANN